VRLPTPAPEPSRERVRVGLGSDWAPTPHATGTGWADAAMECRWQRVRCDRRRSPWPPRPEEERWQDSARRQFQPTAIADPGSAEAVQAATDNALGRITLDDGRSTQNPATVPSAAGLVYLSRSPRGRRSSARPHLCAGDGTRCGMGERVIRKLTGVSIR
jgi:hypothetical protein